MRVGLAAVAALVPWCVGAVVKLTLDRATAHSLLVDVTCDDCGGGGDHAFSWEHKTAPDAEWSEPSRVFSLFWKPNAFYVMGLAANTLHHLRARRNGSGEVSDEIVKWTCEERPPPVTHLRVEHAGAGWFDVRWHPPKESCRSFYYYHMRYRPLSGNFTESKRYGYFEVNHAAAFAGPSHPCTKSDFCVLLTDHVQPGQLHEIELKLERIGGINETSERYLLNAIANTEYTGFDNLTSCADGKNVEQGVEGGQVEVLSHGGVAIPLWLLVLLGVLFLVALVALLGLWAKFSCAGAGDREKKSEEPPPPSPPPVEYLEERYVDPGELGLSHFCNDTLDENLYEEINIQQKPESKV